MKYYPVSEFESCLHDNKILRMMKPKGEPWYVKLLPDEKPYNPDALYKAMSENIFIIGDLHIGDPIENWEDKRDKIVATINSVVKPDDHLLILGDLSAHTHTANIDDVRNTLFVINCKNIYLILGNNDQYSIETYVSMGFKTVTDKLWWKNYLFTHCPVKVIGNQINIHGHMHEENQYINCDWRNHINIWDSQYVPKRLKEYIALYNAGYYNNSVTINDKEELEYHKNEKYFGVEESLATEEPDIVDEYNTQIDLYGNRIVTENIKWIKPYTGDRTMLSGSITMSMCKTLRYFDEESFERLLMTDPSNVVNKYKDWTYSQVSKIIIDKAYSKENIEVSDILFDNIVKKYLSITDNRYSKEMIIKSIIGFYDKPLYEDLLTMPIQDFRYMLMYQLYYYKELFSRIRDMVIKNPLIFESIVTTDTIDDIKKNTKKIQDIVIKILNTDELWIDQNIIDMSKLNKSFGMIYLSDDRAIDIHRLNKRISKSHTPDYKNLMYQYSQFTQAVMYAMMNDVVYCGHGLGEHNNKFAIETTTINNIQYDYLEDVLDIIIKRTKNKPNKSSIDIQVISCNSDGVIDSIERRFGNIDNVNIIMASTSVIMESIPRGIISSEDDLLYVVSEDLRNGNIIPDSIAKDSFDNPDILYGEDDNKYNILVKTGNKIAQIAGELLYTIIDSVSTIKFLSQNTSVYHISGDISCINDYIEPINISNFDIDELEKILLKTCDTLNKLVINYMNRYSRYKNELLNILKGNSYDKAAFIGESTDDILTYDSKFINESYQFDISDMNNEYYSITSEDTEIVIETIKWISSFNDKQVILSGDIIWSMCKSLRAFNEERALQVLNSDVTEIKNNYKLWVEESIEDVVNDPSKYKKDILLTSIANAVRKKILFSHMTSKEAVKYISGILEKDMYNQMNIMSDDEFKYVLEMQLKYYTELLCKIKDVATKNLLILSDNASLPDITEITKDTKYIRSIVMQILNNNELYIDTNIIDLSKLHSGFGKLYLSDRQINDINFLKYNIDNEIESKGRDFDVYSKLTQAVMYAMKYNAVFCGHGKSTNGQFTIEKTTIYGKEYTSLTDLLDYIVNTGAVDIIVVSCNGDKAQKELENRYGANMPEVNITIGLGKVLMESVPACIIGSDNDEMYFVCDGLEFDKSLPKFSEVMEGNADSSKLSVLNDICYRILLLGETTIEYLIDITSLIKYISKNTEVKHISGNIRYINNRIEVVEKESVDINDMIKDMLSSLKTLKSVIDDKLGIYSKHATELKKLLSDNRYNKAAFIGESASPLDNLGLDITYSNDPIYAKKLYDGLPYYDKMMYIGRKDWKSGVTYNQTLNTVRYRNVILCNNRPVGFIEVRGTSDRPYEWVGVVTHPNFRGKGISTYLFNKMIKEYNPSYLFWTCEKDNLCSQHLASKLGFTEIPDNNTMSTMKMYQRRFNKK